MISAVIAFTLKFDLIGDTDADALGALCCFGFQRGKAGHGGFGFQNFGQLRRIFGAAG